MKKIFSIFAAVLFAGSMMAANYEVFTGELVEGDYLITYDGGALKASVTSSRFDYTEVTATAGVIADPDADLVWHLAKSGDNWTIYNADADKYAGSTGSKNQGALLATVTDNAKWVASGTETYDFENVARAAGSNPGNKWLRRNGGFGFACYANGTGGALTLYKLQGEAPAVAKPVISGEDPFFDATSVTLSCTTEGADIYYTLDGTDPTEAAEPIKYMGLAINLTATTTVKAAAYDANANEWSAVAEKTFNKIELMNCAEASVLAKDEIAYMDEFTVAYVKNSNIYIKDASGSALIFAADFGLVAGDVVSGFIGVSAPFNGLPELKPQGVALADLTVVPGEAPDPEEMTAAPVAADVNKYVILRDVTVAAATFPSSKNMDATIGEETFVLRNNFDADVAFDTEKSYDITGAVAIYTKNDETTVQVYFFSAQEHVPTAIDNTNAAAKAVKAIENGRLVIIKNGVRYDVTGAELK